MESAPDNQINTATAANARAAASDAHSDAQTDAFTAAPLPLPACLGPPASPEQTAGRDAEPARPSAMPEPQQPTQRLTSSTPVAHHLLLCATPTKALCCPDPALGAASWERLKRLVRELDLENPARPGGVVLRNKADCLRICAEGPVLLIWPEGIVYGGVSPDRVERIVREHVIGNAPIEAWIVRRYYLAS